MANKTQPSIQDLNGKIGIGVTTPKTMLHIGPLTGGVNGEAQERLRISGDYAGTNTGALIRFTNQHDSGTNPNAGEYNLAGIKAYDYRSDWGGALALQTAPNTSAGGTLVDRITILPEGLVGINTTGPTSLLTVNDGNIKIIKGQLSGGTDFDFLQLSFNGGWSGNVGGLAAINFTDSITSTNTVGRIGVTYTGSQGKFVVTDLYSGGYGASGDAFTIQADGKTYIKGNTGIGTTSPSTKLDIDGGINATGKNFLNQSNLYNNPTQGVTGFGNKSMDSSISYYDTGKTVATAVRGIVWTGKHYIVTDYQAQTAKFYDSNFDSMNRPTGGTINLPNDGNTDHPHGATWDGRYLYCIQYAGDGAKIVAYDLDNGTTTASIMFTKALNNTSSTYDVEYAEGHLYTVTDGAISKYKLDGNRITHVTTSSNLLSGLEAQSITYDGSYLWVTQNGHNMYQVRLDCTLKATLTTDIPPENVAMAWNGQNTVSVNHTNGKVYVLNTAHTRFDTEQFSIMGGNVGIGFSDNPGGDKLHVNGTLRVGPYFSESDRDFIKLIPHGSDTRIHSPNERFHIENPSGHIVLTTSGGVGIGTTAPISKFHVINESFPQVRINDETNGGESGIRFRSKNDTTPAVDLHGDIFVDGTGDETGRMGFRIPWNGTEKMTILSSGNVGIGTTSPASKLQVGDYMASNVLTIGGWYGGGGGTLAFKSGYVPNAAYVWDTARIKATDDGNFNGRIEFQTTASGGNAGGSPTTKMVLKASGNVGIGTTSPSSLLHINKTQSYGTLRISPTTQNGESAMAFYLDPAGTGTGTCWVVGHAGWGNTGDFVIGNQTAGGPVMLMQNDGRVGIGTTSPNTTLEIKGTIPSANRTIPLDILTITGEGSGLPYTGSGGAIVFKNRTYTYGLLKSARIRSYIDSDSASNRGAGLVFEVTDSNQTYNPSLFLKYNGYIGIGSTNPGATLDVNGGITASSVINSKHHKYWNKGSISNTYVKILQVGTNNGQLSSSYTLSGVSHGNGHVGNFVVKILVNHHQDISVYSTCGGYSVGTFKVESDSNGQHHLSFKSNSANAATYYFHLEGHSDSSTFTVNPTSTPNTSTTHEHLMNHGTNATFTGFTPLYKFNETLQAKVLRSDGDVIAYYSSDKRLKENIVPIKDAIGKIKQLSGYEFDWNDKQETFEGHDYGVLAQEVEKVLPELVKDRKDGFKGVRYEKLASVLIEGIKEQQTTIENQQKQIDELKDLVGSLIKK
jgi:hypothetical protein